MLAEPHRNRRGENRKFRPLMIMRFRNLRFGQLSDIVAMLPNHLRRWGLLILSLSLVGALIEMIGVGMIFPAIAALIGSETQLSEIIPFPASIFSAVVDQDLIVVSGLILVVGVYLFKSLFIGLLVWQQSRFVFAMQAHFSHLLFAAKINQDYATHAQENSAELVRNITTEANELVHSALQPMLVIFSECAVLLAISLLLIWVEPVGALLMVLFFLSAMFVFQLATKKLSLAWGRQRQREHEVRIKFAQEALGGIRDVILFGKQQAVSKIYEEQSRLCSKLEGRQFALVQMPRLWLETIGVIGLCSLVVFIYLDETTRASALPVATMFGVAAFRMLPSGNRILSAIQSLRYATSVTEVFTDKAGRRNAIAFSASQKESDPLESFVSLNLNSVSYRYAESHQNALTDVSLEIHAGEKVAIVGKSGSGKSTLVDLIIGFLPKSAGEIRLNGSESKLQSVSWRSQVGYVHQNFFMIDDTLENNITFGAIRREPDEDLLRRAIKIAQLEDVIDGLPNGLSSIIGERGAKLSGGQKQRIAIARALYSDPQVLILDEATSALDVNTERKFLKSLFEADISKTVILVTHRLSLTESCDQIIKLVNGKVINHKS